MILAQPDIKLVRITNANTERVVTVGGTPQSIRIQNTGSSPVRMSFESGAVSTPSGDCFWTIKASQMYLQEFTKSYSSLKIYLATASGFVNQAIQILSWR